MEVGLAVETARRASKLIASRAILEIMRQMAPRRSNDGSFTGMEVYLVRDIDQETRRRMAVDDNTY